MKSIKTYSHYILLFLLCGIFACTTQTKTIYESANLKVEKLSQNTYRHISYLSTKSWGKVPCNGMIVIDKGEALVFDTPTTDSDSEELIDWIKNTLKCKTAGIVITHFHVDCLGGLAAFHKKEIPSYASNQTIQFARADRLQVPQHGFEKQLKIKVGAKLVINTYFGAGHTYDNIVSYFPDEKVLFGGCLIKSVGASKGNLEDANTAEWSNTVRAIQSKYGEAKIIIPGHGKPGGQDLLEYTIDLFKID